VCAAHPSSSVWRSYRKFLPPGGNARAWEQAEVRPGARLSVSAFRCLRAEGNAGCRCLRAVPSALSLVWSRATPLDGRVLNFAYGGITLCARSFQILQLFATLVTSSDVLSHPCRSHDPHAATPQSFHTTQV
jgi:hypothetical protein